MKRLLTKRSKSFYILPAIVLVLVGTLLGMKLESSLSSSDTFEQLRKLENAYLLINRKYVEKVDPEETAEEAIAGMLKTLDPHSSFFTAEEVAELRQGYQGSFGGVGIYFEVVRDTARVISPISGGPSEKVGVRAGDQIVAINDSSAIGIGSDGITDRLKGEIGTTVSMTVERNGVKRPITYTITRGKIPIYTVDASYMIDQETGYLRLNRFAMTTPDEVREHMQELKEKGMQRLVLDLRDNPGGVMEAAVEVTDMLLGGREMIVYTRGRDDSFNAQYHSTPGGTWETQPVMVLVNSGSASASEIVAGALQDHDRAFIVGRRTFGKGLVQRPFELTDGSVLQLTVSRYYTPAGRLIQTPYDDGDRKDYYKQKFESLTNTAFDVSDYVESVPDSLKYETDHGRVVFGGGGILPDYFIPADTTYSPLQEGVLSGQFVPVMRDWFLRNEAQMRDEWKDRQAYFVDSYTLDQDRMSDFWAFAEDEGFTLTRDTSRVSVADSTYSYGDLQEHRRFFSSYLKASLARELFGVKAWYPVRNQVDPVLAEAMRLWDRAEMLAAYHTEQ